MDVEAKKAGFAYIKENAPSSNNDNQFMEWSELQVLDPSSKLYGWDKGEVERAVRSRAAGKQTARTIDTWILTLKDIKGWFLDFALLDALRRADGSGILWGV